MRTETKANIERQTNDNVQGPSPKCFLLSTQSGEKKSIYVCRPHMNNSDQHPRINTVRCFRRSFMLISNKIEFHLFHRLGCGLIHLFMHTNKEEHIMCV